MTSPVVPQHRHASQLSPQKLRIARTRIAVEQLTILVQDLEVSPLEVRQAALHALTAVVELQAALMAPP